MAIPTRNNTPATTISFGGTQTRGFVPAIVTSDNLVTVMLLGRKGSSRDSILQKDAQGKQRGQVLLQLVGVVLPLLDAEGNTRLNDKGETVTTCYPDPEGKTKLPPMDSVGFKAIMSMPTGIFVESIYEDGMNKILELIDAGYMPDITRAQALKAIADGSTNTLFANKGGFLRSIDGIFKQYELTVSDIMSGQKTMSITLLGDEAEAFSDSYTKLQEESHIRFQNVAMVAQISPVVQATELTAGISYQPTETHFFWKQTLVGTRTQYMLDASYAKSGRAYSAQTVSASNVTDLAMVGTKRNYESNVKAIAQGSAEREAARIRRLNDAMNADQVVPSDLELV